MDHFEYRDGILHAEEVDVHALAAAAGTPTYVYSERTLLEHFDRFAGAFSPIDPLVCFAVKSCGNLEVLRRLVQRGAGLDLVSGGELHRAQRAGADPARCVFAGVGKTDDEIDAALQAGVGLLNVESEEEFRTISRRAGAIGTTARCALRVNPDVDARAHRYTTTGVRATKFGVDIDEAESFFVRHRADVHARLIGLHVHLGSPVAVEAYEDSIRKVLGLIDRLESTGVGIEVLDLGGGFAADYETGQAPLARAYAERIIPLLAPRVKRGLRVVLEPGRQIAANAGILLTRVVYVKRAGGKTFAICDAGMGTLLRPSLYGAFHFAWPCAVRDDHVPPRRAATLDLPGLEEMDVVGPICETGDFLATGRHLPPVQRGDLIAIFGAGAYGMSMASRYNSRPLPAEILVEGASAYEIRSREAYDDLVAHEVVRRVDVPVGAGAGHQAGSEVQVT